MAEPSRPRPRVNLRSTAVKRIMQEAAELADPDTDDFIAGPLESDIFEWHCTLRGVKGTDYEGGLYHLRIILPPTYPMSAPDIVMLTPNGRFELGKKICIDGLTSFHAGSWQPAWGVRTAITGLRAFWTQDGEALSAIGALDQPPDERRRLAKLSREWTCTSCGECNLSLLPDVDRSKKNKAREEAPAESSSSSSSAPLAEGPTESSAAAVVLPQVEPVQAAEPVAAPQAALAPPSPPPPAAEPVPSPRPAEQPAAPQPAAQARLAHTVPERFIAPAPAAETPASTSRRPPLWIDALIGLLVALLLSLLARRA